MTADPFMAASGAIDAAVELLKAPTAANLAGCAGLLERAVSLAAGWRDRAGQGREIGPATEKARMVRTSVRRASRLLESAAGLYAGWGRVAGVLCEAYAATGETGAFPPGARLSVRG